MSAEYPSASVERFLLGKLFPFLLKESVLICVRPTVFTTVLHSIAVIMSMYSNEYLAGAK